MLKLYNTFVLPHLNYCNLVWGGAYKTSLNSLYITQKRALKICLNLPRDTPSKVVFDKSNVTSIQGIHSIQTCILMYKYHNNLLPNSYNGKFKSNREFHQYQTKSASLYHIPKPRTNKFKMSLMYKGPILWNNLSVDIRNSEPLSLLKSKLKSFFV